MNHTRESNRFSNFTVRKDSVRERDLIMGLKRGD
jgi:hypothetical protein